MVFLKFVLIFILIIYVLRLTAKYFLPVLLNKLARKYFKQFENVGNQDIKKEGEVTIKPSKSAKPAPSKDSYKGEYTDFEEIKD